MADALDTLKSAGIAVDQLPEGAKTVLASLSDEEARTLASIQKKLDAAGEDVGGYARSDDGTIFW